MSKSKFSGDYTKAFLSDDAISKSSKKRKHYEEIIKLKDNEVAYIFDFKEDRMIYAKGFEKFMDIKDEDVNVLMLNSMYTEIFKKFTDEYHDRALLYLNNHNKNIKTLSSSILAKVDQIPFPVLLNITAHETDENGNMLSIISKIVIDEKLQSSDIIQYSFEGEFDPKFLFNMNHMLDFKERISRIEIEILEGIEKGKNTKEIANTSIFSETEVEDVLLKVKNRFNISTNAEMIDFANKNFFLPNQFDLFPVSYP